MHRRPTLLSSCAKATTAAEAHFRIDVPIAPARAARVVAFDEEAASVLRRVAELPWSSARFFVCENISDVNGRGTDASEVALRGLNGVPASLSDELADADLTLMVATVDIDAAAPAAAAVAIGTACATRGIMTAGLILGTDYEFTPVVSALRRFARVLMVPSDEADVIDVLTALRA